MINIADLKDSDIGRLVTYRSKGGDKIERGIVSGWNDRLIFVRYETYPEEYPNHFSPLAAATNPEDLEWYKETE